MVSEETEGVKLPELETEMPLVVGVETGGPTVGRRKRSLNLEPIKSAKKEINNWFELINIY